MNNININKKYLARCNNFFDTIILNKFNINKNDFLQLTILFSHLIEYLKKKNIIDNISYNNIILTIEKLNNNKISDEIINKIKTNL